MPVATGAPMAADAPAFVFSLHVPQLIAHPKSSPYEDSLRAFCPRTPFSLSN
jgi:hypothetical protein